MRQPHQQAPSALHPHGTCQSDAAPSYASTTAVADGGHVGKVQPPCTCRSFACGRQHMQALTAGLDSRLLQLHSHRQNYTGQAHKLGWQGHALTLKNVLLPNQPQDSETSSHPFFAHVPTVHHHHHHLTVLCQGLYSPTFHAPGMSLSAYRPHGVCHHGMDKEIVPFCKPQGLRDVHIRVVDVHCVLPYGANL